MDDPIKLLAIVREFEFNSPVNDEKRLKNTLGKTLKKWEDEVDFISFATAFEIQGRLVVEVFNGISNAGHDQRGQPLTAKQCKMIGDRYEQFRELIKYREMGTGIWPWDILRQETLGENGSFPPKILLLNKHDKSLVISEKDRKQIDTYGQNIVLDDFAIVRFEDINLNIINQELSHLIERDNLISKSWQWFAVYPTMIAEEINAIRGNKKTSKALVYLLGTRKEFAKRPQNDYGLIVGVTEEVIRKEKLAEVIDAIVFAWNMLAVSPHILEDGLKIASLEAGRHTVHTVRSYITVQALPLIKYVVGQHIESEQARELIINLTNEIATLPAMMSFVSRRPLENMNNPTDRLRTVDYSEYKLIEVISVFFQEELSEKRGFITRIDIEINSKSHKKLFNKNRWINELYLISALCEVVANIEKNTIAGSVVKVDLSMEQNKDGEELFRIKVINYLNNRVNKNYEYDRQKNPIHGLKSLEAFFKALGGYAYGELDQINHTYTTVMSYNLTRWEKSLNWLIDEEDNS